MKHFVIYKNPSDYPGKFVVREFLVGPGVLTPKTDPVCVVDKLVEARSFIPAGCIGLPRNPDDDLVIVETWI